ncbi:MAG: reverse transcriptase family protein [Hoeflea sp.]|uniref:reverse transcriptase family protein n=1 Tax=Hoeflea sp. TaxID=1940281 RepID=UPI001D65D6C0|nr:reverse transcriptase family protein [Hoeflea sp.]MBU4528674.1 reverse transcriptase family protein [Alphaproteobacteria bacterium]MBU4545521.1 reverse transcriptase family protein [Alphaproteobacteria bacterium]MBU4552131.1 reverse transcriptase family protein [Alphaproteobacteria bacterium]MBV1726277.1 reverse transcriptase family protein [Hoeflea sp.]MBV1762296.1 reverse transcriptase family protein [Hoeflea sp.]
MERRKYTYRDSPFFRLSSKAKLAKLLRVSPKKLQQLANLENGYHKFSKQKKNGGNREINAPIAPLKDVQSRIAGLLSRIAPPDYLFAPVAGRSYVGNAALHIGSRSIRLLDIMDFFPSCTIHKAIWFFRTRMECPADVAVILAKIVTHEGVLPQGSPCSPILAYFCYVDMWTEISTLVNSAGCKLSVYADDLTISGAVVPEAMIWSVKKTMFRHGHRYARHKERSRRDRPAEITGVIVRGAGVVVPNRQLKKILEVRNRLEQSNSPETIGALSAELRGRIAQIGQVRAGNRSE